jgi:hypothetical protein
MLEASSVGHNEHGPCSKYYNDLGQCSRCDHDHGPCLDLTITLDHVFRCDHELGPDAQARLLPRPPLVLLPLPL